MENIKNILTQETIFDNDALNLYISLIERNTGITHDDSIYVEKHHILPKSMFKEYRLSKWNLVNLTYDDHIEAHRLLMLMYQNSKMKRAYSFITRNNLDEKIKFQTSGAFTGDENVSKKADVRKKISEKKTGVERPDMKGKKYFGASKETYELGIKSMSEKLKETVIVRDKDGNKFRVSIDDERYLNGELVSFNKGIKRENSATKRPEVLDNIMSKRNATYDRFKTMSYNDVVEYLIDANNTGKNIFCDDRLFARNYVMLINKTNFKREDLHNTVVQRLSKA